MTPKQAFFAQKEAEALALYNDHMAQAANEWREIRLARKREIRIDTVCRSLKSKPQRNIFVRIGTRLIAALI